MITVSWVLLPMFQALEFLKHGLESTESSRGGGTDALSPTTFHSLWQWQKRQKAIPPPPRFRHVSLLLPWQLPLWEGESNKLMGVIRNCSLGGDSSKHIAIACHKRKGPLLSSSRDIHFACISHLYSSSISAPLHIYCRDTMSVSGLKIICHSWRSIP